MPMPRPAPTPTPRLGKPIAPSPRWWIGVRCRCSTELERKFYQRTRMDALFRKLGMDRPITRRDFLNGMAVTVASTHIAGAGLMAQAASGRGVPDSGLTAENYPPL